jgi:hypothetical protein
MSAGAGAVGVMQAAVLSVIAQQQSADVRSAALGIRPADHDELLPVEAPRLHPNPEVAVLRDQPATLIATVHDEAVFLVPNDMQVAVAIAIADIARKEMVAAFLDVFPNAPTVNLVEPKIGSNRGDLHFMTGSAIDAPGASSLHFLNS